MTAAVHPLMESEEDVDTNDGDPDNMMLRAGFLVGLSYKYEPETDERKMLQRASRSLVLAARKLYEEAS